MKKLIVLQFIILMIITSCSVSNNGFIAKHTKKKIHLTEFNKPTITIGYETDSAITYFRKNDLLKLINETLESKGLNPSRNYRTIKRLKATIKIIEGLDTEITIKHWFSEGAAIDSTAYFLAGEIDNKFYRDLILKSKAMVYNKIAKKHETIIYYHFVADQLGGKDCYYTFENGVEFHRQLLALGE